MAAFKTLKATAISRLDPLVACSASILLPASRQFNTQTKMNLVCQKTNQTWHCFDDVTT